MKICYRSYLEFMLKADVLTRELSMTPKDAAELLAKVSGYHHHSTMPVGQVNPGPPPTRADLILRLLALRPDICPRRAANIITKLGLPKQSDALPAAIPDTGSHSAETRLPVR